MIQRPSPNFGPRKGSAPIDMLVFHYTGMESAEASLDRLCDPAAQVSAHYLIDEKGCIYQLVEEAMRAWHAGVAYWRGDRDVNSRSVGIELQNVGHDGGLPAFEELQIKALITLSRELLMRHPISPLGIVGHSDVAPDRKTDPGERFPWKRLAEAGVGVFPAIGQESDQPLDRLLTEIGYDPEAADRVAAFQRRFQPDHVTGHENASCSALAAAYLSLASS